MIDLEANSLYLARCFIKAVLIGGLSPLAVPGIILISPSRMSRARVTKVASLSWVLYFCLIILTESGWTLLRILMVGAKAE